MHQRQNKRTKNRKRNSEYWKNSKESRTFEHQICEEKNVHSKNKRTKEEKPSHQEKELLMSSGKSTANSTADENQDEEECIDGEVKTTNHTMLKASEELHKETDEKEAENEKPKEESESILNSRNKKRRRPLTASKKENLGTTMESKLKISRSATMRRRR